LKVNWFAAFLGNDTSKLFLVKDSASKGAMALSSLLFVSEASIPLPSLHDAKCVFQDGGERSSTVRRPHHVKGLVRRSHLLVV